MAKKDLASQILNQMESGTYDIYNKYSSLIKSASAGYDSKLKEIDEDYDKAKKDLRVRSGITLQNDLDSLSDKGLSDSGVAMQMRISSNAAEKNAASALDSARIKAKSELNEKKASELSSLDSKMQGEVNTYRQNMYKEYLSQLEKDRNYEYKLSQASSKNSKSSSSSSSSSIKPSKKANELLKDIIAANTKEYKDKGYKTINKTKIKNTLNEILNDPYYSEEYKHELKTYAKIDGYL